MLAPLALFVTLLLVTAFIAHWSDNYGKRLGKKRVSVFGLRPRTSATILTVASSWGIMLVTLVVLLVVVTPLQHALFSYDAVRLKAAQASEELETAQLRLQNVQQQSKSLLHDNKELIQQKRQALSDVRLVRSDLSTARTNLKTAQSAAATSQNQAQIARESVRVAATQRQQAVVQLTDARAQLTFSQTQLSQTKVNLSKGQEDVKRAQADLRKKQAQVKAAETKLKNARRSLNTAVDAQQRATAAAFEKGAENIELDRQNIALSKQRDDLKKQSDDLTQQIAKTQEIAAQSTYVANQLALNDIRLPVDQTLSERRIDGGQSSLAVEKELKILLDSSKRAATVIIPKVTLFARAVVPDADTQVPIQLDQTQTLQLYARLLARANQSVSARIAPIANYPANTSEILARFVFIPIRTIYIARENIASTTIDTSKSESAIFGQLNRLVEAARVNAVKRGSSPPLSPEEVNFFDGDTGQKLFDALRQVQKVGHPVEVRVVAARDLDSAEPLQIRFVVGDQTA